MSTYIDISFVNFKCWLNNTFRLVKGVNLFVGDSGAGKSTVCKGIYFVLYGGRKFKNIQHRNHPNSKTEVSFTFISPTLCYKIVRTRPSEALCVELQDSTGIYKVTNKEAQAWIDGQFGIETDWIASSYISRKNQHFLIDSTNMDKMKLLQHMSFGEEIARNQPDTYLAPVKILISQYTENLKMCNEGIKIRQGIKSSIISRNGIDVNTQIITREQHGILLNKNSELSTILDRMRFNSRMMKNRIEIENKIKQLEKFTETIESIDLKYSTLSKQYSKYCLTDKLKFFDIDILSTDKKELEKCTYLYEKYLQCGWSPTNPLSDFLSSIKNELSLYESQMKLEEKNNKIKKSNSEKEELNNALKRAYLKQKSDYDSIINEISSYEKKKIDIIDKYELVMRDVHTKFSVSDDLSSTWLIGYKVGIEMSLTELICPNCNHGLILENGRLQKGTLNAGEDGCENLRRKQKENLALANLEYEKRVNREKIISDYNSFSKIIPKVMPDLPEEPKKCELEQLIPVKNVKKPTLDVFEIPSIQYDKYLSLKESLKLIDDYNHLLSLSEIELVDNIDNIRNECDKLQTLKNKIIKVSNEKKEYENSLMNLPQIEYDIDQKIAEMEKLVFENKQKIEIGNVMREIENIDAEILLAEQSVKNTIESLEYLEYWCSEVESLANETLMRKLNELNGPLSVILSDLFRHPLTVELTPYKQLKSGDTKTQINFNVLFKGVPITSTDEFSDGEEGRLSLALLIAFSRINKNPFMIIDEVLSSVHSESQNDCIDIINRWSSDKFVIHICHSVSEGHHYNIINFPPLLD